MPGRFARFLIHWIATALSLWAATHIFTGIRFSDPETLVVAALVLGLVNAVVRPILVVLTFPLTIVTLGLFLLVINACMLMLVAWLVTGFQVAGFGTALLASLFISVVSTLIAGLLGAAERAA
jgi:putative membrane protein